MKLNNPLVFVAVLFLGAIIGQLVSTIYAQVTSNTIYACVKNQSGSVRIVGQNDVCSNGETSLSWSQQGPVGPTGPVGQSGSTGLTGATGPTGPKDPEVGSFIDNNLSGQYLVNMNFGYRNFSGTNFSNAGLQGTSFGNANLANAVFNGANLTDTSFSGSTMSGTSFVSAFLIRTGMGQTDFTGVNFTGAIMSAHINDANFTNANFTNANMESTTGEPSKTSGAIWSNTKCPDGTNSNTNGGTCVGHFLP